MKVTVLSDLHGYFPKTPGGDLLILAGDYFKNDNFKNISSFFNWLNEQKYKKKILIAGNHDNFIKDYPQIFNDMLQSNTTYLQDAGIEYKGYKIWGTPHSVIFPECNPICTAFMGNEQALEYAYAKIPDDTEILISHTPPRNCLDLTIAGKNVGSFTLRERIENLPKLKLCIFGHIHEGYGQDKIKQTTCINSSHVNQFYEPVNDVISFIL